MTDLILPSSYKKEQKAARGKDIGVGISPWDKTIQQNDIVPKKSNWQIHYRMYQRHFAVRAAIDKISKTATNVGYDFVPRDSRSKPKKKEIQILKDFFDTQEDFILQLRRVYKDLLIYGDAYLYIVPNRSRQPHALKRLNPSTIAIQANKNGSVKGYVQYDPRDMTKTDYVEFESHEIIHIKMDDPDNDLYGLSPLVSLENSVATDLYAQNYNAAFFQNSGISGTIIAVKGVNPAEIERNRRFIMDNYTGPDAAHKPIFLEGDNVTVAKSVETHEEMAFLDQRKFSILEILAVLDVPPAKIGIMESANRSNSKEQDKTFRTESITPLQNIVENAINGQFVRPILGVQNTIFVHAEGDIRDAIEQMDYYTRGIGWGVFNPNEVRSKLGMAPVEGGDINGIMTPTGFIPLDRMDLFFGMPKTNDDKVPPSTRDPLSGEPLPQQTPNTIGDKLSSSDQPKMVEARKGMMILLGSEKPTKNEIIKAYSHFKDAEGANPHLDAIGILVKKAKNTFDEDEDLAYGYFEQVKDEFYAFVQEKEEEYGDD